MTRIIAVVGVWGFCILSSCTIGYLLFGPFIGSITGMLIGSAAIVPLSAVQLSEMISEKECQA